jgi:hypothetical protein
MQIIRKYRKLDWFDFIDTMTRALNKNPEKEVYIEFIDELRMKKLDSMSEGATFKMKVKAKELLALFEERMNEEGFADEKDLAEVKQIIEDILC